MTKMSTMLGMVFLFSLFVPIHEVKAQDQTATLTAGNQKFDITEPKCNNMTLSQGDYCLDSTGELSVVTSSKARESRFLNRGKDVTKHRHLRKNELNAYLKGKGIVFSASADGSKPDVCTPGGVCTSPTKPVTPANDNANTNDNTNPANVKDPLPNANHSSSSLSQRPRPRPTYRDDPRKQADADLGDLQTFCNLLQNDLIPKRQQEMEDVQAQIDAIDLAALKVAERKAYAKMLTSCRKDCIKLAIVKDGVCAMTPDRLGEVLSKEDLQDPWLHLGEYYGGQSKYTEIIEGTSSVDATKACSRMLSNAKCKEELKTSGFSDCEDGAAWLAALTDLDKAQKLIAELKAKQSAYAKNSAPGNCKVTSADDASKPHWDSCNTQCLEKGFATCPSALADADYQLKIVTRTPYCPDCGTGGEGGGGGSGSSACMLYGNCGGVSTAAQIIGAIGGVVTPLGLGLMNMSMNNRSLAACTAMYAMQIELSQNVGLPPTGPNCGGMGGMGGGFMGGMNGMGMGQMYNPMMGMNGMGMGMPMYNPMMGMQGQIGMMNPFMGMNAGFNIGMNPMMGMGQMGMNGMYNPMMMQQGQMGVQSQMYNAQLQMQQNAYQQMAAQNSMMYGYNNAGSMYGMNNMYQSPMYSMGMQQPFYNPSMYGMGMNNYGYGNYYNPMSMFGGQTGFNAGVNFNAGLNWY